MIFVLVAGTYTPFASLVIGNPLGTIMLAVVWTGALAGILVTLFWIDAPAWACLLYTSDAADDPRCVDLGGRRIIKKKQYLKDISYNQPLTFTPLMQPYLQKSLASNRSSEYLNVYTDTTTRPELYLY